LRNRYVIPGAAALIAASLLIGRLTVGQSAPTPPIRVAVPEVAPGSPVEANRTAASPVGPAGARGSTSSPFQAVLRRTERWESPRISGSFYSTSRDVRYLCGEVEDRVRLGTRQRFIALPDAALLGDEISDELWSERCSNPQRR
jgi:hypothetical protein